MTNINTPDTASGRVQSKTADGVATISFSHPKSNSLPGKLLAELAERVTEAGENRDAKVILLRSEGDGAFCAGASFAELQAIEDAEAGKRFFMGFVHLILAMIRAPKFVVTRVQGRTVGGGVGIVSASDYAIAVNGASLKLSELAVGLGPFIVGLPIQRKIGMGAFPAMSIDADWRSAKWGKRHGLYAEVHRDLEALDDAVAKRVAMLAASNPVAMAQLKKVFWEGTDHWAAQLEARATMSGMLVLSEFTSKAVGRAVSSGTPRGVPELGSG
ncbi:MAG TPA: enoyl-CoA hydratase/isomerase family protein [Gemmatimonadaceae bacterium]|nr:enoyl-CoA hydratase/isomerase family protein [Gemmatimonadaceae bacterium]